MAQQDIFAKVDGIPGESKDEAHKDEIQLEGFSIGADQEGTFGQGGGGSAGKVRMHDFQFTMKTNKASVPMKLACWNGKHIPKIVVTCRKAGEKQLEFFKATFDKCLISSFVISGQGTDIVDQVSVNFQEIQLDYSPQKDDGSLDSAVSAGWVTTTNVKK